jgi:hypothetical protein
VLKRKIEDDPETKSEFSGLKTNRKLVKISDLKKAEENIIESNFYVFLSYQHFLVSINKDETDSNYEDLKKE